MPAYRFDTKALDVIEQAVQEWEGDFRGENARLFSAEVVGRLARCQVALGPVDDKFLPIKGGSDGGGQLD